MTQPTEPRKQQPSMGRLWEFYAITGSLLALSYSCLAFAAPTVRDQLQNASKAEYQASMNIWFDGAISALLAGNADLTQKGKVSPLFCLPKGQGISSADAMKLVNQELESRRWKDFVPLTTVLLNALQRSFPCWDALLTREEYVRRRNRADVVCRKGSFIDFDCEDEVMQGKK